MSSTAAAVTATAPPAHLLAEVANEEHPQVLPDQSMLHMRVNIIESREGFNPRWYRDPQRQEALTKSIDAVRAVITPITVRPKPDMPGRYEVVAGEGRWLSATDLKLPTIPVIVRHLSDRDALNMAVAENKDRTDMSPAEEARAARRLLDLCEGDRIEVRRRLNWKEEKLEARLLLLNASDAVLRALAERRIDLGHAEHLTNLVPENQDQALDQIIKLKLTVAELGKSLSVFALDLATAVFDTAECTNCPHNTTRQASLFEAHLGAGRCARPPCFREKTKAHLAELRSSLNDSYNTVRLQEEVDPASFKILLRSDVGEQQFDQGCKGCKNFGCLISTHPSSMGKLTADVCFGADCRQEKMAAHQERLNAAKSASASGASASSEGSKAAAEAANKTSKAPSRAAQPKRVEDYIHGVHRNAAAAEVRANRKMVKVYLVLSELNELNEIHHARDEDDPLKRHGIRREGARGRLGLLGALSKVNESVLDELLVEYAARIALYEARGMGEETSKNYLVGAQSTLRILEAPMEKHFMMTKEFLSLMTKSGIESVLNEAGFPVYYNRSDKGAFKHLMAEKHADIVKTVMESGFDFTGFVPQSVRVSS